MPKFTLNSFLRLEANAGVLLVLAAVLAVVVANSPASRAYQALMALPFAVSVGEFSLGKPLFLWINDGLMAIFFLLIGLELKREIVQGQLRDRSQLLLPAMAAIGGFTLPAAIYVSVNWGDTSALNGWAVPAATDIAFALAVLKLLGTRVPIALTVFLTSLAIFDDLAAIVVIAMFYTSDLSAPALALAGGGVLLLALLNVLRVDRIAAYVLVGVFIWVCVLRSGVHATLAGVVLAAFIPSQATKGKRSPLLELENSLHPWVAFLILPVFAFANAGISLSGSGLPSPAGGVSVGVMLGLLVGKPLGIFVPSYLAVRLGLARLPDGVSWAALYGVATLSGIGFTMSLLIGSLAFEHGGFDYLEATRFGVIAASTLAAVLGYLILARVLPAAGQDSRPSRGQALRENFEH